MTLTKTFKLLVFGMFLVSDVVPAIANAFDSSSPGRRESYGINDSALFDSGSTTLTTHHRLGNESGIGNSSAQTTSVTSESTRAVDYTPTNSSPAILEVRGDDRTIVGPKLFSRRMLEVPVLTSPFVSASSFSGLGSSSINVFGDFRMQSSTTPLLQFDNLRTKHGWKMNLDFTAPFTQTP